MSIFYSKQNICTIFKEVIKITRLRAQFCSEKKWRNNCLIQCCGSGFGFRRAKMTQKNRKVKKFHLLKCRMFSSEGWMLLLEGIGIRKLQFFKKNFQQYFFPILGHQNPGSGLGIGSGFTWTSFNGSTTLVLSNPFCYVTIAVEQCRTHSCCLATCTVAQWWPAIPSTTAPHTYFRYVLTISHMMLSSVESVRAIWQPARWLSGGQLSLQRQRLTHISAMY